MIKGHIYKILWDKISSRSNDYLEVGLLIKDLDQENITLKIKGTIKINPYPSINDYIIAKKTDKIYSNDIYVCSSIYIDLPIKKDLIFNKIIKLSDKLLTKNETTFLIENNKDIWNLINNKKLNIGKIKEHKINNIYNNFIDYGIKFKDEKEIFKDFLDNCDIKLKNNQIDNLIEKYTKSNDIIHKIYNNLIELLSINSISINTLISIAEKLNHSEDEKIKLFIMKHLKYSSNGDTCILRNELKKYILKEKGNKLSKSLNIEFIDTVIDELINNKFITPYKEYLYDSNILDSEIKIGNSLKFINSDQPYLEDFLKKAEDFLEEYSGNKLNNEQKESFLSVFKSNINITIGPAGTGKSEILTRLCKFVEEYEYDSISILFLTPTGKACDRLTKGFKDKNIEKSAYTIHKYNYYDDDNKFKKEIDDFEQNKNKYNIIVIDEMSMVSLNVFYTFINKFNDLNNCVLLLLGDCNQLPSIDFGDVLNNLVLAEAFNIVKLIKIFRSESKSLLTVQNNILNNIPLDNIDVNDGSFVWIKENPSNIECIKNVLNDFEKLPLIITSTNKVVNEYQNIIKDKYNIDHTNKDFIKINNIIFHIDDKIMIKKNNYEKQLMNGMVGKIISILKDDKNKNIIGLKILFDGEDKPKDITQLEDLEYIDLAYIITIHKSQGSEADYVIILLDEAPMLNTINLIYTAITRAKKKCILISQEKTLKSIKKKTERISNLKDFC